MDPSTHNRLISDTSNLLSEMIEDPKVTYNNLIEKLKGQLTTINTKVDKMKSATLKRRVEKSDLQDIKNIMADVRNIEKAIQRRSK